MRGEDLLARGPSRYVAGQRLADLGEQPQRQRMPFVGRVDRVGGQSVPFARLARLVRREVTDADRGRQPKRGPGRLVQYLRRAQCPCLLPVLGAAADHHPHPAVAEPLDRARGPVGEPVGQLGRHLLGPVQQDHQRAPGGPGQAGDPFGRDGPHVAVRARRGEDAPGLSQRAGEGVGDGGVVGVQIRAAQPHRGRGAGTLAAAAGERGEFGRTAGAGIADESHDEGGEGAELPQQLGPFDRVGPGTGAADRAHGGRGEFEDGGQVEVLPVGRDGRGIAPQQVGEGPVRGRRGGPQGQRESRRTMSALQCRAEDGEHSARRGVEHGAAGGPATQPQRVAAVRPDRQLHCLGDEMEAVGGGVGHLCRSEDPGLAPAAGGQPHVCPRLDPLTRTDRQGPHTEAVGAHQREAGLRQRGDGVGLREAGAVAGRVQHQPHQPVDSLMAGHDRAELVGDEPGATRPPRQIADTYQRCQVPASHGATVGRQ